MKNKYLAAGSANSAHTHIPHSTHHPIFFPFSLFCFWANIIAYSTISIPLFPIQHTFGTGAFFKEYICLHVATDKGVFYESICEVPFDVA